MTDNQLLARLNAHFSTNSQFAGKIFIPDLMPMIGAALQQLAIRVKNDPEKKHLLLAEQEIDITDAMSDGFWKANLKQAQDVGIITAPPFPQVSIGNNIGAFFSAIPPAPDQGCQSSEDTYYVIGTTMVVETTQDLTVGVDKVAIVGYKIPTLATLPVELEDDLIDLVAERLSSMRQSSAREEK